MTTEKTVKKETMLIAIAISLLLGFLAGTIFTTSRLSSSKTTTGQSAAAPKQQGATLTDEQAKTITALEAEVQKDAANGEAWTRLGNLYFDTNQVKKAIDAYSRALAILPANADILTDLGVMYRRDKQPDKAIESFDKAIQTNPRHETARMNKGIVLLFDLGRTEEALQTWQELLTMNPEAMTANGQPLRNLVADITKELLASEKEEPEFK